MTLEEKYRYLSRRSNPKLIWYVIIAVFLILETTLARYTNVYNSQTGTQVAKWNIKINNTNITNQTDTINLIIKDENGDVADIIRSGDTGYVEIEIDPSGTEVSIEYSIGLSFIKGNLSMNSSIQFTEYSLNDESSRHAITNNTISGTVNLDGKSQLTNLEKRQYKIYWTCADPDLTLNTKSCTVNAEVIVQQKIA